MIFIVYLTIYAGDKMPPFYIGSTSLDKILSNYRGTVTSKKWKSIWEKELLDNPKLFSTHIIRTCNTRVEAFEKELEIQKSLNVVFDDSFINMAYANKNGFFGPSQAGIKKSKEHTTKISNSLKNKKKSAEHIEKMRKALTGKPLSEEHKKAVSESISGDKNPRAKTFKIISPNAEIFTVTGNLRNFCKEYNISFTKLYRNLNCGPIQKIKNNWGGPNEKTFNTVGWEIQSL